LGTDFFANKLNEAILNYNADVSGKLITDAGLIAVSNDPEQTGKNTVYGNAEIVDKLANGEMFSGMYTIDGKKTYKVFVPVVLGNANKTWFYVVEVPEEEIYAKAQKTGIYLFVCCLIGALLIAFAGGILIWAILKDITSVTDIIRHLSLGNINVHIDSHRNQDEVGKMKNELSKLVGGLKRTSDFAQSIGEGDLNAEFLILSDDDVLGNSLLEMRQSLQKAEKEQLVRTKEEEQRNWGTAGLAMFADILRHNNDNLEALSYNIISNMVKYLGANQGGIFLLNDTDSKAEKVLEMKACYAFDRKKFTEKIIHPGEGLIGVCYLEGEPIYLTEVPESYITITSGLGDANPTAVLICPLKVNDEILGVVELASFKEFEPYQHEFVLKVSQSIAATISSVSVSIRTERLLSQTKLQAEEMANQEEELRQNMEEMIATQEEMRRREDELNNTLEKMKGMVSDGEHFKDKVHWYEALLDAFIESPISVTDMDKNVTFLNQAALNILGKTREEVVGKKCGCVWGVDICKDERCGIEYLKRGMGKSVFNVGDAIFTTDASYIKDRNGNNIGHIEVVANITESTNKLEYNKKEVEQLAANIAKMAEGDIDCDFTVVPPNEYTQDEYKNYSAISSNLEQVRNTIRNLLSQSK
jgi:PAS domain-containing protein/HAMP domain-containing protein